MKKDFRIYNDDEGGVNPPPPPPPPDKPKINPGEFGDGEYD